ncbi:Arginyl-tRNA synthetase, class Ic isoform 4 [Hibiscus syriacus]|uniref:Arginyl-tRNA synthetase, class Ic isoform 4 n=1 Tax=Hibiscus syriacus TaxID=106335 RepID=A0A6A2Z8M5_HIBSY|nr:Arginyl-tRNA synthetase, class Ic isoform 4 [Hibiscus syriacus]
MIKLEHASHTYRINQEFNPNLDCTSGSDDIVGTVSAPHGAAETKLDGLTSDLSTEKLKSGGKDANTYNGFLEKQQRQLRLMVIMNGSNQALTKQGLVEESNGARVIFVEGINIPLTVVKSDGGFNYASTDLAALCSYPKASHVGFGLVLGEDGKRFRTRNTEVVRLVDLLDEAKSRSKAALTERGKGDERTEDEIESTAEAVGYGAVVTVLKFMNSDYSRGLGFGYFGFIVIAVVAGNSDSGETAISRTKSRSRTVF